MPTGSWNGLAWALIEPVEAFANPQRRVFWPFLLTSAVLAAGVWARHVRRRQSLVRFLFPAAIWWHPSARLDYAIVIARALLRLALVGWFVTSSLTMAVSVSMQLRAWFGTAVDAPLLHAVPKQLVPVLFAVAMFVIDDAGRYVMHRAMHRVPALWELHKVHHAAEVMTPLTLYRVHPIESALNAARALITSGIVTGCFLWMFGRRLRTIDILGVDAIGLLWTALGSNLRHSQVWLSFGPVMEHLTISPAQHQVHHSRDLRHRDRNFGSALALWDWCCGTLYVTKGRERLQFGLDEAQWPHGQRLVASLLAPVWSALSALFGGRLRDPRVFRPAASEGFPVSPRTGGARSNMPSR